MAIEKPKIGDKVWVMSYNLPKEGSIEIISNGYSEQFFRVSQIGIMFKTECFPTLDSLLDDLRSRAIHLPKE